MTLCLDDNVRTEASLPVRNIASRLSSSLLKAMIGLSFSMKSGSIIIAFIIVNMVVLSRYGYSALKRLF